MLQTAAAKTAKGYQSYAVLVPLACVWLVFPASPGEATKLMGLSRP
jgi:hypothetical protein